MAEPYKLTATPFLLLEGEDKGHLETVTFIATSERDTQKWWSANVGSYETALVSLSIHRPPRRSSTASGLERLSSFLVAMN